MESARRTVLVVEDDGVTRELLARCLGRAGWEMATARSGAEAVRTASEVDADVVLLDLGLPDMDGLDVLAALKDDPRTAWVPVVVVTGRTGHAEGPDALRAGAHDFVGKPFRADDLEARLSAAWQVAARHRQMTADHAALARSESDYRLMATTATDVVWRIRGTDSVILWVSPSVTELLGSSPADLVGTNVLDLVHRDDRIESTRDTSEGVRRVVQRLARRDGSWAWCETTLRVVIDPGTGLHEVHSTSRDVTARLEAHEAVAASAAKYRQLVDLNGEAIDALDADGVVTFANPAMGALLGWKPEEIIGLPITDFMDADATAEFADRLDRRRREPTTERYEIRMRHRCGHPVWVTVTSTPVVEDGRFLGTVALLKDVTAQRAAERALAESEARYRHLVDHLPGSAVLVVDRDLRVVMSGGSILGDRGYDSETMPGRAVADVFLAADVAFLQGYLDAALQGVASRAIDFPSTSGWHHLVDIVPLVVEDGVVERVLIVSRDVTATKVSELARRAAEEQYRTAFEFAPVGMAQLDLEGRFLRVNRAFGDLFGHDPDDVLGMSITTLCHPDEADDVATAAQGLADGSRRTHRGERRYLHAKGHAVWVGVSAVSVTDPSGAVSHVLAHFQDVTDRKRFESQLQHMAEHDPLTGLRNRRGFETELDRHTDLIARYGPSGALLLIDLDHFKQINDTLGHNAGDELIVSIADLLRRTLRETDVIGRLGGDEFAVILPRATEDEAERVAAEIVHAVRDHVTVLGGAHARRLTASIGLAMFDDPTLTGEEVLVNADLSMYDAKDAGRNRYSRSRSSPRGEPNTRMRLAWVDRITEALEHDRFVLHAQPILDLRTDEISRYELLLRMVDHDGALIAPAAFLHIAERVGLIRRIDRWVIDRAIRLLADPALPTGIGLEVNVSGVSIGDDDLLEFIEERLAATGADPGRLVFEITETAAVANIHLARNFADRLARMGCRFALDDFGAGFGSFYYLKHLPFDYIKIDGEFIAKCMSTETDRLVIDALVTIARGLQKETIAEFVGDEATLQFLRGQGVDHAQGYHVGRPRDVATILTAAPTAPTLA
jgi:diguanylate cyclase (GGDEF)-like protein/PAS domain S-box-containing protein